MSSAASPVSNARPPAPGALDRLSARALLLAGQSWCTVAAASQLLFAAYIGVFYGGALLAGHPERWSKVLAQGWVGGRTGGNAVMAAHLLFACLLLVGGALQLVPAIRRHAPTLHRWNGRVFVVAAATAALAGAFMVWTRPTAGDLAQHMGITFDALLIVLFGVLAWRAARARRIDAHRRWALRLYLVAAATWFFRIGLMGWIVANHGPAGFDPKTFTGPVLSVLAFAQTLLPLAVLELWLRARTGGGAVARLGVAALLGALTLMTAFGAVAAAMILWLPHL